MHNNKNISSKYLMIKIINSKLIELILENKFIFITNLLIFNILFYLFYIHDINKKYYLISADYLNFKNIFEINERKLYEQIITLENKNDFIELKDYDVNINRFTYILKNENDLIKAKVAIKSLFNKILEEEIFNRETISALNMSTFKLSEKKFKQDLNYLKDEYVKDIDLVIKTPKYLKELSYKFSEINGYRFYSTFIDEIEKLEIEKTNLFYLNFYQDYNQISNKIKEIKNNIGDYNEKLEYIKNAYKIFDKDTDKFVNIIVLRPISIFVNKNNEIDVKVQITKCFFSSPLIEIIKELTVLVYKVKIDNKMNKIKIEF